MTRKIGISVISLAFFSWGPWGPWYLGRYYRKTGIPFQLVPLLGWTKKSLRKHVPPEAVIAYEGCWNKGETFLQMLRRIFGKDPGAILGLLLFGVDSMAEKKVAWFRELYPWAFAVDLGGESELDLREISPYNNTWRDAPRLVYDTLHRREAGVRDTEVPLLIPRIRLVHLQTRNRKSFQDFLAGRSHDHFAREFWYIRDMPVPIILELMPFFLWPSPMKQATLIRDEVKDRFQRLNDAVGDPL